MGDSLLALVGTRNVNFELRSSNFDLPTEELAGPTRLELATSGVTGQRSNQLNYDPAKENFELRTSNFERNHWYG